MATPQSSSSINQGAKSNIYATESKYTVSKELKFSPETYEKVSCDLFKGYLLLRFPYLESYQRNDLFYIPANVLIPEQIEEMFSYIYSLGLFTMGYTDGDIRFAIDQEICRNEALNSYNRDVGVSIKRETVVDELKSIFMALREFLVVEYFTSMNVVQAEAMVHNKGFFVKETDSGNRVSIELENWAGNESTENTMEDFTQKNLEDLIKDIDKFPTPDEKEEAVFRTLQALRPVAVALDFMVATTRPVASSVEGKTVITEVKKESIEHFDVKPENIFLRKLISSKNGKVVSNLILGDYGLAQGTLKRRSDIVAGTAVYMAPELLSDYYSDSITSADIYSFAVTIAYILFGTLPETHFNMGTAMPNPKHTPPRTFGDANYQTNLYAADDQLDELILRGLVTETNIDQLIEVLAKGMSLYPKQRYTSCREMLDDVIRIING